MNEVYKSSGKKYNGEKAIISLTSWKARINNVSKTLFSLIQHCPGFHIVLVLSEEEFPKKETELPENLMMFVNNDLIEILWVYKNYKSFKKIIFTMQKYKTVPIITADDDMFYAHNYAEELYDIWFKNKNQIVGNRIHEKLGLQIFSGGCGVIYPPNCFGDLGIKFLSWFNMSSSHDDLLYAIISKRNGIKAVSRNDNKCLDYQQKIGESLWEQKAYNDEKQVNEYSSFFK